MRVMRMYFRAGLSSVSRITVQTRYMQRKITSVWGFPANRIDIVPSAVEEWVIQRGKQSPHRTDPPYICYVSSASPHKNHTVLAPMMADLKTSHPNLKCHLTVSMSEVPQLVLAATRLGVLDSFTFRGGLSAKAAINLVHNAELALMPSRLESFGIPYYEALALSCPMVAAARPFAEEALGEAGLYANPDDGLEFAAHVAALLDSKPRLAERREMAGQRFIRVRTSWQDIAQRYLYILERLTAHD